MLFLDKKRFTKVISQRDTRRFIAVGMELTLQTIVNDISSLYSVNTSAEILFLGEKCYSRKIERNESRDASSLQK